MKTKITTLILSFFLILVSNSCRNAGQENVSNDNLMLDQQYISYKSANVNMLIHEGDFSKLKYLKNKKEFNETDLHLIATTYGFENITQFKNFINSQNKIYHSLDAKYGISKNKNFQKLISDDIIDNLDSAYKFNTLASKSSCETKLTHCRSAANAAYAVEASAAAITGAELAIPTGGWGALVGVGGIGLALWHLNSSLDVCYDNFSDCTG